jgi:hypothetical protein
MIIFFLIADFLVHSDFYQKFNKSIHIFNTYLHTHISHIHIHTPHTTYQHTTHHIPTYQHINIPHITYAHTNITHSTYPHTNILHTTYHIPHTQIPHTNIPPYTSLHIIFIIYWFLLLPQFLCLPIFHYLVQKIPLLKFKNIF